jgi:hypothetical protein
MEGAKFCTTCGTPVPVAPAAQPITPSPAAGANLSTVKNKIVWNIQKGEVACHLNESEFIGYDGAQGLIVNDGTTAYIKSNGRVIAEIHGGVYDFVDPKELEDILKRRTGGAPGALSGIGRLIVDALAGRRVKDKFSEKDDDPKRWHSLEEVVESMKKGRTFSLQLKLDRSFPLVFESTVRTRFLDVPMGMRAVFRITDFGRFSEYFLADERSATTLSIAEKLKPTIDAALQSVMADREMNSNVIPQDVAEAISSRLGAMHDQFYGLSLERVAEVVASNEDLERLRALGRELYLSEHELDALHRTNDFRNRLTAATNQQLISDARSDQQLHQNLNAINRDKLLSEDELDNFYTALLQEKRLRDAKNEAEVEKAMLELEKLRATSEGKIALEMLDVEITGRRKADAYTDERRAKEREHSRAQRQDEIDLDNAEMDAQLERMRRLKEMERTDKQQDMDHAREMERLRQEAIDKQANMTAEQIMAMGAAGGKLDAAASAKFAESFSAGRDAAQMQQATEARRADSERHREDLKETLRMMSEMAMTMTGHITGHNAAQQHAPPPQPQPPQPIAPAQPIERICPECGVVVKPGIKFCANCGYDLK